MNNVLAKTIRNARKAKKYTLKDLAEMTDKSISYICEIEHGRKTPSLPTTIKIFHILNINIDELSKTFYTDFKQK